MARKLRVHYDGAIYHVIARGNNKDPIFLEAEDKRKYNELLLQYKQKYHFDIYAYVLMDNHIHLLICVRDCPLAKIMQGVQQTYTQYFNRKYQHVGHVFQQRYKAFLCKDDSYLLALICYIHQNPLRAKLPEGINYTWSSHKDYMVGQGRLVNIQPVMRMFSDDRQQAKIRYIELVSEEQDQPTPGDEPSECMKSVLVDETIDNEQVIAPQPPDKQRTLEELGEQVATEQGVSLDDMLGHCRIRKVVEARNMLIYRAVKAQLCTKTELAVTLGVDPARITRGYQQIEAKTNNENKSIFKISQA